MTIVPETFTRSNGGIDGGPVELEAVEEVGRNGGGGGRGEKSGGRSGGRTDERRRRKRGGYRGGHEVKRIHMRSEKVHGIKQLVTTVPLTGVGGLKG